MELTGACLRSLAAHSAGADLSYWLELPEGPARELAAATTRADGDDVAEALEREPLWRGAG